MSEESGGSCLLLEGSILLVLSGESANIFHDMG